jgi:hypothetical protein
MCAVESHQFSSWHLASTEALSHSIHRLGDKRRLTPRRQLDPMGPLNLSRLRLELSSVGDLPSTSFLVHLTTYGPPYWG